MTPVPNPPDGNAVGRCEGCGLQKRAQIDPWLLESQETPGTLLVRCPACGEPMPFTDPRMEARKKKTPAVAAAAE